MEQWQDRTGLSGFRYTDTYVPPRHYHLGPPPAATTVPPYGPAVLRDADAPPLAVTQSELYHFMPDRVCRCCGRNEFSGKLQPIANVPAFSVRGTGAPTYLPAAMPLHPPPSARGPDGDGTAGLEEATDALNLSGSAGTAAASSGRGPPAAAVRRSLMFLINTLVRFGPEPTRATFGGKVVRAGTTRAVRHVEGTIVIVGGVMANVTPEEAIALRTELAWAFVTAEDGDGLRSVVGMTVRRQSKRINSATGRFYNEVYSYLLQDGVATRLPRDVNRNMQLTDHVTGRALPPLPDDKHM